MSENKIPNDLDEAIEIIVKSKNNGTINGMAMRNSWGLWSGSPLAQWFYTKNIYHADDMSGIISESYQRHINNQPRELDEQIKKYHAHWEKYHGPNHLSEMRKMVEEHIVKMRDDKINKIIN